MRHITTVAKVPARAWTEEERWNFGWCLGMLLNNIKHGQEVPSECSQMMGVKG